MIIACPACSTGFNLPEAHLRTKGAKLRCSKCSHVFRVRLGANGQPEIFYRDGEEPAPGFGDSLERPQQNTMLGLGAMLDDNPKTVDLDAQMQEESSRLNRTSVGMPRGSGLFNLPGKDKGFPSAAVGQSGSSRKKDERPVSTEASSAFSALPSFGETRTDEAQFDFSALDVPDKSQGHGGTIKLFDELEPPKAKDDLFGDAFAAVDDDDDDFDPFVELSTAHDSVKPKASPQPAKEDAPMLVAGQPKPLSPGRLGTNHSHDSSHDAPLSGAAPPKLASAFDFGAVELPEPEQARGKATMPMFESADDLIDPSFGADSPAFDPQRGVIGGPAPAPAGPAAMRPPSAAPAPQLAFQPGQAPPLHQPHSRPQSGVNPSLPAAQAASQQPAPGQDVLAPHRIGGGGVQKVANLALITLIVLFGFFGLIAALNDGFIDFKNFGQMIDVAFGGKTYSPRPEWSKAAAQAADPDVLRPASKDSAKDGSTGAAEGITDGPALKPNGVWAEVVSLGRKKEALVVRGKLSNQGAVAANEIKVKVLLVAKDQEDPIASAEGFVGQWLNNKALKKAKDAKAAQALLPKEALSIEPNAEQPFTVIFDEVPKALNEDLELSYKVELP